MCAWGSARKMDGKAAREMKAEALYRSFPNRIKSVLNRILKNLLLYVKDDCFDRIRLVFDKIYT